MRFGILRTKTVLGANVAGFILGTALFSMFLMLTLYMQQVLGYSAMKTGVAYLAVAGTSIIWANVAAALVNKVGVRPLIAGGMAILDGRHAPVHAGLRRRLVRVPPAPRLPDHRARDGALLRADLDRRAGRGPARPRRGLASGLINTRSRSAAPSGSRSSRRSRSRAPRRGRGREGASRRPSTSGFQLAFWVGAGDRAAGVVAALVLIREEELAPAGVPRPSPPSTQSRAPNRSGAPRGCRRRCRRPRGAPPAPPPTRRPRARRAPAPRGP